MSEHYFFPQKEEEQAKWLAHFARVLPTVAVKYGFSVMELSEVNRMAHLFGVLVRSRKKVYEYERALSQYRNVLLRGLQPGQQRPPVPELPQLEVLAALPSWHINQQLRQFALKITSHCAYSVIDGLRLGITTLEETSVAWQATFQPRLQVKKDRRGRPLICWGQEDIMGVELQVDRGLGWTFLACDTPEPYTDSYELPPVEEKALWSYRAIYKLGQQEIGRWSNEVCIRVARPRSRDKQSTGVHSTN